VTAPAPRDAPRRHPVFQFSLMSALLAGVYDGELTVRELLQHGDFGLGTFNSLDGEMIIVDGVCHRLRSDGGATLAGPEARIPFAVVTEFTPSITAELPADLVRDDVVRFVRRLTRSENYLYAVRVTGHFAWVRTRTVRLCTRGVSASRVATCISSTTRASAAATCWTSRSPRPASNCARPPICTWRCRCPTLSVGPIWIRQISINRCGRRRTTARTG